MMAWGVRELGERAVPGQWSSQCVPVCSAHVLVPSPARILSVTKQVMCECQDPPALYLDLCPALASFCRVTTRVRDLAYPQDVLPFSPPAHPQIRS